MNIIPLPAAIEYHAGFFKSVGVPHIAGEERFAPEMRSFREQFAGEPVDTQTQIFCSTDASCAEREEYRLQIEPERITVSASCSDGLYHGLQTVRQLLLDGTALPCALIKDRPRFSWRGFMLDTARHFYTVPFIKKLLDSLSLHHINVFHWHLTDDQGWRLPVKAYPLLTEIGSRRLECRPVWGRYTGGFYSEEDIRSVLAFAASRHIEVVPEVDLPGHASAILASYPGLGCTGGPYRVEDRTGVFEDVLCAGTDAVFDLAAAVFDTITELFPSKYVHIGGDEVRFNRWEACPKCRQRLVATGLKSARELQSWMTVKLVEMLAQRGRTAIGWDEVLEDTEQFRLPHELIVMSWRGSEGGEQAARRGHKVIMAPSTKGSYLDYRHTEDPEEPGQLGITRVSQTYALDPCENMTTEAAAAVIGGQANLWSELIYAGKIAEYMIFPRICALAEAVWTERKDFTSFAERLPLHQSRLEKLHLVQYRGAL
ncbi:MAG: beta-N-acetylhexosaminidase [Spirochaetaceae bacterium]|jgi:hexosaminidase|nr:beta-N-acetylhexosaminidase [Spirochaetaceae bacterium]